MDPLPAQPTESSKAFAKNGEEGEFGDTNPTAAVLELVEGSGIGDAALLADPTPELGEVDEVVGDAPLVAQDPGDEAHHGERPDYLAREPGEGVGFPLHVPDHHRGSRHAAAGGARATGGEEEGQGLGWEEGGEEIGEWG